MSIFKKYSYWIHSGKYTAIQKLSTLLMGIISFMFLARVLGPEGFGIWGLFLVISSITETARTALIRNAFIRFMHQTEEKEHGHLQAAAFVLSLSLSIVISILFILLSAPVSALLKAPSLAIMLNWYALTFLVTVIFAHCEMLLNAKMDFRGVCFMYCVRQGFLLLIFIVYFYLGKGLNAHMLSLFYLMTIIAGSVTGYFFSRPYLKWQFSKYRLWIKELWKFGKYVFVNNACSLLFRSTDNFITSKYFGPGVSAYYNASLRIGNLVDMPSQVLGDILFPKAAKYNASDKGVIKNMYEKTVGATLIFSLPALLIIVLMPETILHILAGKKFLIAAPILRITAFFGFTLPFLKQFGTIMDATGHPDVNFSVMFSALCINILANIVGVHFFGVIGAAIGTASTYFILFIITQYILNKRFGVRVGNIFQNTFFLYGELLTTIRTAISSKGASFVKWANRMNNQL